MSSEFCDEMRLLLQADIDGELSPAESARVASHLNGCASCAAQQTRLAKARRIGSTATYHRAPEALRQRVRAFGRKSAVPRRAWRWPAAISAAALVAGVLLMALPSGSDRLADEITSDHIRALQPGHLLDVASSDRHTVKPWFAGKLDFAPTVVDLADHGFPLEGGRLDYVAGRPVAVLVYKRREHVIDVYIWPADRADPARAAERQGFNLRGWLNGEFVYWAVSDLESKELAELTALLQSR